ncbi:radical SAM enzyme [Teratosphaeria nubilosa]|uniref:Radical SAM enzyme n=1 Tax=Teratosphaeria nubilosa TaxID=161662 RepID=A0A6G1L1Q0_9PEZI|nr:radical SAM enzyme [Teratosphaeria nubilosa]
MSSKIVVRHVTEHILLDGDLAVADVAEIIAGRQMIQYVGIVPVSVNYHFSRKCNKTCTFCFHTEKSSAVAKDHEWKKALKTLKEAGMRKINFAGGEPFLYQSLLQRMVEYCKKDLQLEAVSIISNGTVITKNRLEQMAPYIDVLGVSCDSFNEKTNEEIGRGTGDNVNKLFEVREWCRELNIKFKLNTVICTLNWEEDMAARIAELDPFRWKVFQVLVVGGENDGTAPQTEREKNLQKRTADATKLLISREQFDRFCDKHKHLECFVPEPNELMASSYLILDEFLCFLDKGSGKEKQSACILDVGVEAALKQIRWDQVAFENRGGLYDWSKDGAGDIEEGGCGKLPQQLTF